MVGVEMGVGIGRALMGGVAGMEMALGMGMEMELEMDLTRGIRGVVALETLLLARSG